MSDEPTTPAASSDNAARACFLVLGLGLGVLAGMQVRDYLINRGARQRDEELMQRMAPRTPPPPPMSYLELHAPTPSVDVRKLIGEPPADQQQQGPYEPQQAQQAPSSKHDGGAWM
jgi:hypothetical protein